VKPASVAITVNGRGMTVEEGTTVAAGILTHGEPSFRKSPSGEQRAPLCGMGICFECRVTIDGVAHRRSCMTIARAGMNIVTATAE
jgi:predicted molibdopterin-dependent oxidoreductase YjgC